MQNKMDIALLIRKNSNEVKKNDSIEFQAIPVIEDFIMEDQLSLYLSTCLLIDDDNRRWSGSVFYTKLILSLIGSISGVSSLVPSMDAAGDYTVLGYFFAGGTLIAYGAGSIFILCQMVDEFKPQHKAEKMLFAQSTYCRVGKHISINILSLLTTVIPFYTAYKYNNLNWKAFVNIPVSYGFNVYGFNKIFNLLHKSAYKKNNASTLTIVKQVESFTNHIQFFVVPSVLTMEIDQLASLNALLNGSHADNLYCKIMDVEITSFYNELPTTYYRGWPRFAFQAAMLFFPLCTSYVNGTLAREAAMMVTEEETLIIAMACLPTIPAVTIDSIITFMTAASIFDIIFNKIKKNPPADIITQRYQGVNTLLISLSLIIALLSSSNKGYISYSTVMGNSKIFFTATSIINSIIFEAYALTELSRKAFSIVKNSFGNANEKIILRSQDKLSTLVNVIKNADPTKCQGFFCKKSSLHIDVNRNLMLPLDQPNEEKMYGALENKDVDVIKESPPKKSSYYYNFFSWFKTGVNDDINNMISSDRRKPMKNCIVM